MQRAEIITVERRRRWSLSEKQELVAETLTAGASVSAVAQRHGMHPSQLFAWRKAARDGRLVEDGTHDALIKTGGRYASLHRLQAGLHEVG